MAWVRASPATSRIPMPTVRRVLALHRWVGVVPDSHPPCSPRTCPACMQCSLPCPAPSLGTDRHTLTPGAVRGRTMTCTCTALAIVVAAVAVAVVAAAVDAAVTAAACSGGVLLPTASTANGSMYPFDAVPNGWSCSGEVYTSTRGLTNCSGCAPCPAGKYCAWMFGIGGKGALPGQDGYYRCKIPVPGCVRCRFASLPLCCLLPVVLTLHTLHRTLQRTTFHV